MSQFKLNKLAVLIGASLFAGTAISAEEDSQKKNKLDDTEVIEVTATGRMNLASQIPMNVTAMGAEELRNKGITDIKRLISDSVEISAPGNSARFAESVTVRGLNVSNVNANNIERFYSSTLAYYLDSTPLPNIAYRIKDVSRVETLLGPQGTLYGGGSLGGTVRYITNKPELDAFTFNFNTSLYQRKEGSLSHDTDLTLNLPLSDTLAVRANINRLDDNGYTDRIKNAVWWTEDEQRAGNGVEGDMWEDDDWEKTTSGRVQVLWKPTDKFSINLSYINQDQLAHGTSAASRWDVDEACEGISDCSYDREGAPFQVDQYTVQSVSEEFSDRTFEMTSLELSYDFGFAMLTSSTAAYDDIRDGQGDYLAEGFSYYGWIPGMDFDSQNESAYIKYDNEYKGIEHETRLVSQGESPLSWIAGFYYSDRENSLKFWEIFPGLDKAQQDVSWLPDPIVDYPERTELDSGYFEDIASDYTETAIYGEVSYQVTDAWQLTVGARFFNWEDTAVKDISDYTGAIGSTLDSSTDKGSAESIFKFNTAYYFDDDKLAYFTASQGYRRGGTNGFRDDGDLTVSADTQRYNPDTTNNYELGYKASMLDNDLYVQANVFLIQWEDTQTYFSQTLGGIFPLNGTANGPSSESTGVEFHLRYNITDNLTVKWGSANSEAQFTDTKTKCIFEGGEDAPGQQCRTWYEGGDLGGSPEWRHNASINYYTDIGEGWMSTDLRARYVGEQLSSRADADENGEIEEPYKFDSFIVLNASISYGLDDWNITAWVDNLTDEAGETSYQRVGNPFGHRSIYTQPRTVGVNFTYNFMD
ncbi:TonB-dependent receptor [Colwellia sp. RSH04]|uniref:TonB-dependent receptor n=1 Tax=Colwellia sp. RSH04 TaxID=2305464 RepID=UPI000E57F821|nr:TonB-dependent receptor [Colwellia sp. RSH04]RHW76478.1 TonB-dependent receptor [Colwellia sp. RSH04]